MIALFTYSGPLSVVALLFVATWLFGVTTGMSIITRLLDFISKRERGSCDCADDEQADIDHSKD